jgi:hypothetical protein
MVEPQPGRERDDVGRWLVPLAIALLAVAAGVGAVFGHLAGGRAIRQVIGGGDKPTVPGMGRVEITSRPPGAHVFVDGRLVGITPLERVDLDPGRHAVVLEMKGYESYTGAVAVTAGKAASLEAQLAKAAGGVAGVGGGTGTGTAADGATPDAGVSEPVAAKKPRPAAPPPRPRRDCGSEKSRCDDHCDDANFDCTSRCPFCGSCNTSMTWEECNRQCQTCRQGCEQNKRFCDETCEANEENCEAANRD